MRIACIGTGSMGNPVAHRLLNAGHELRVHDIRPRACADLVAAGAVGCADPADAADGADAIVLSLPSQVEVELVCFGERGVLSVAPPGSYLVDLTTVSMSLVPRLVAAQSTVGVRYLAAPVSQGVDNARIGRLSVFVGGEPSDVEACRPLLEAIATVVIHTGDQASAVTAKLLTNLLWYVNAAAIGEALVLGAKGGIPLETLRQVVLNSCGTSWVAEHDIPSIYAGHYDPSFTTKLCTKDLGLITELAELLQVPIGIGAAAHDAFRRSQAQYGADSPELSVVRLLEDLTGVRLQPDGPT